jgi:intein/homing endonuclease
MTNILTEVGFEHLHLHTDFSLLDGYGTVEEYAARARKINMNYLCVSDHGMMGVIPRQIRACEGDDNEKKLRPIFACELYLQDKHPPKDIFTRMSAEEKKEIRKSYHLLAIAFNNIGYSNLVKLSSWAWLNGYYYRPRVTHEQLLKYKEGIIFTSCCYNSEIGQAFDKQGEDAAFAMIEKYRDQFGENFYLELMLLDFNKQKPYDKFIVKAHDKYHIPLIVTNDCHYCNQEDSKYQRYMLMIQKETSIKEIEKKLSAEDKMDIFELQDTNLWMKSETELNQKWVEMYQDAVPYDLYVQAKKNTVEICNKAKGVELDRSIKLPRIPDAEERFKEAVINGAIWRGVHNKKKYITRLKEEYELICRKDFASYFLIQKQMTDEARRICPQVLGWGDGSEAVGPGRGCLSSDAEIVTKNGIIKKINDIEIGDKVVTRDGHLRTVIDVMSYDNNEELLNIKCFYGSDKGISLTKDHLVLIEKCHKTNQDKLWAESTKSSKCKIVEPKGKLDWVRADQIKEGDWLFVPIPKTDENILSKFDLAEFANGKELHFDEKYVYQDWINPLTGTVRKRKKMKRYVHLSVKWHTIIGLFAGDGWLRSDGSGRVGFCFHSENDLMSLKLLEDKLISLEVDYYVKKSPGKKLIQVLVNNKFFYLLFKKWFNRYKCTSNTKHVPDFIFTQGKREKAAYLRGYLLSDGHSKYKHKLTFTTCSDELASQTRYLCWQLGIPAGQTVRERIDKRNGSICHSVTIRTPHFDCLSGKNSTSKYQYRTINDGMLMRVRKITCIENTDKVYDFTVDGEHNYLTTSFIVHNSAVGSLVCYCLGITDVDPIRHNLLFSRFLSESRGGRSIKLRFNK